MLIKILEGIKLSDEKLIVALNLNKAFAGFTLPVAS
jgi:hypothetical protein